MSTLLRNIRSDVRPRDGDLDTLARWGTVGEEGEDEEKKGGFWRTMRLPFFVTGLYLIFVSPYSDLALSQIVGGENKAVRAVLKVLIFFLLVHLLNGAIKRS